MPEKIKLLNPLNDFVFKAIFGRETEKCKVMLIDLINAVFKAKGEDNITAVEYLNPFNYKEYAEDKMSILDLKVETEKGEKINVKIQVKNEDYFRKRSLYYWAKTYTETIKESEPYHKLKKTIIINIMNFIAIEENNKLHTHFKILEKEEHFPLIEDLQIHYLELKKLPKKDNNNLDELEMWLLFLKEAADETSKDKLEKIVERSEKIKMAMETLREISSDEKMQEIYLAREKTRKDLISKLAFAEAKGKEEGREEERKKARDEKIKTAEILLKERISLEIIAKSTNITIDELKKMQEKLI